MFDMSIIGGKNSVSYISWAPVVIAGAVASEPEDGINIGNNF